jgi:hypothetical protein
MGSLKSTGVPAAPFGPTGVANRRELSAPREVHDDILAKVWEAREPVSMFRGSCPGLPTASSPSCFVGSRPNCAYSGSATWRSLRC